MLYIFFKNCREILWGFHCLFSTARAERYNHDIEGEDTEDDMDDIMFHSFSSCSPRYSKVYLKFDELKELKELKDKEV